LPDEFAHLRGSMGECYGNAIAACGEDPSLRYCEGIVAPGGGRFVSHGWCLTLDEKVLDLTWGNDAVGMVASQTHLPILPHEHWGYWGAIFRPELALAHDAMPMLGRDIAEAIGMLPTPDGRWIAESGLDITPPETLPLLDYHYLPDRKEFWNK
jgi:hypothetical protein